MGGYSLPITVAPDATLPTIPQATPGTHVTDRDQFAAMFTRVVAAAGTDQLLPIFTHVHTTLTDTSITMLATDRYRLSRGTIDAHGTSNQTILLPGPLMAKLLPFCDGTQIILGTDGHDTNQWITLTSGTLTVRILHPHDDYPRVTHLFNLTHASTATLDRTAFRDAADRAHALTTVLAERNTPARLIIDTNQVTIAPGTRDRTADAPTITADTQLWPTRSPAASTPPTSSTASTTPTATPSPSNSTSPANPSNSPAPTPSNTSSCSCAYPTKDPSPGRPPLRGFAPRLARSRSTPNVSSFRTPVKVSFHITPQVGRAQPGLGSGGRLRLPECAGICVVQAGQALQRWC